MTLPSGMTFAGSSAPLAEKLGTPPGFEARALFTQSCPCPNHDWVAARTSYTLSELGFDVGGVCP